MKCLEIWVCDFSVRNICLDINRKAAASVEGLNPSSSEV